MLTVRNLTIVHKKDLTALCENLSFTVSPGERIAVIGEEGNGKSTLLRAVAGDASIHAYCEITGQITNTFSFGFLPQELPECKRDMTAYDYFCEDESFFDKTPGELGELASRLRIPADVFYSEQRMKDFSGGERIKLQLARLLFASPQLLLLDEPSNDLDMDTVRWLEEFLVSCHLAVLFISHDEALLSRAATGILLLERLRRRQVPRSSVSRQGYQEFVKSRADLFAHQEQVARKEREEYKEKMERYAQIRNRVEHEQNVISRRDPQGGRLLKKKMHAVMATGRRFEREAENMTAMPESEEAIFAKLACDPLPSSKNVLSLDLPALTVEGTALSENVRLTVSGREKVAVTGRNGAGKSTLLRLIRDRLKGRTDIRVFYMPQDPGDLLDLDKTPLDMLAVSGDKAERDKNSVALGSMKFTAEEMHHPCRGLSGGQKAKLMFLMMANSNANVLLLDEPTRNLSPLSGPVIRQLFDGYEGCIIAVTHDRAFISSVCTREERLDPDGFHQTIIDSF